MRLLIPILLFVTAATPVLSQTMDEITLAEDTLRALQDPSFTKRREHCGYLGYTSKGKLVATASVEGTMDSCGAPFPDDLAVIASYHTHGAYDRGYFNELPSTIDVDGDSEFLLNGYVSTPGGRMWLVKGRTRSVHLICGLGCLPVDPGFSKGSSGKILDGYTYEDLLNALGP